MAKKSKTKSRPNTETPVRPQDRDKMYQDLQIAAEIFDEKIAAFEHALREPAMQRKLRQNARLRGLMFAYIARVILTRVPSPSHASDSTRDLREQLVTEFLTRIKYDPSDALAHPFTLAHTPDTKSDIIANHAAYYGSKQRDLNTFVTELVASYHTATKKFFAHLNTTLPAVELLPYIPTDEHSLTKYVDQLTTTTPEPTSTEYKHLTTRRVTGVLNNTTNWFTAYTLPCTRSVADSKFASSIAQSGYIQCAADAVRAERDILEKTLTTDKESAFASQIDARASQLLTTALTNLCAHHAATTTLADEVALQKLRTASDRKIAKLTEQLAARDAELKELKAAAKTPALKETETKIDRDELSRLRSRLDKAERQVERLSENNAALVGELNARPASDFNPELNTLRAQNERLRQELDDLLHVMLDDETEDEPVETTETLDTSCLDDANVIVVGGVPIFVTAMTQLHPSIHCYEHRTPPDSAIANADIVWIQVANVSHSTSENVMAACRALNVPFRFFAQKGINRSKRQLVDETRDVVLG